MDLRNLRIGARLGLGFGFLLLLLAAAIALAIGLGAVQRKDAFGALGTASAKERLTGDMRAALLTSAVAMRNVALESDVSAFQKQADKARAERQRYAVARTQFEALGLQAQEQTLVAEAGKLDQAVEKPFFQAVSLAQAMSTEDAIKVIASQVDPIQQKQIALINQLQELQMKAGELAAAQAEAGAVRLNGVLLGVGLAALALGAWFAWLCTRSITRPLQTAVDAAERVTAGDLAGTMAVQGNDEAARLLRSLLTMTQQLRQVVAGVRDTAGEVAQTAHSMVNDQRDLSARTEAQASSLQQTAATMEQLTSTVKKTAESAQHARSLAVDAATVATRGSEAVAQVARTMTNINQSSGRIAEINAVIDGIAFQTNILALNAAVEAARAGEQGRGFAVVASEVRQLAQRSATAAREIKQLIAASVEQAAEGAHLVDGAGQTIGQVVTSVGKLRDIVAEISSATQEQSIGIAQVNQAVSQADSVTQQNAALVETANSSAANLSNGADRLMQAVSGFRTESAV